MNRVNNTVSKVGYSDGITDGRESVFQKGFDTGYENGLATGFELAKYKAFYEVIKAKATAPKDAKEEVSIFEQLQLPPATDKIHFMGEGDEVSRLSQQQNDYLNEKTTQFAKDLPIATSLFSR